MADRIRRAKDIITRKVDEFIQATTSDYIDLLNRSSPSYITYFQLDTANSRQDEGLETINSLLGPNSPNKYKRIYDLAVWGIDALQISNELAERGLLSSINGDFIIPPGSIRPYPGDFFMFDFEGMENHLFVINDVQFDRATPEKYYRCSFALTNWSPDLIYGCLTDDYVVDNSSSSSSSGSNDGSISGGNIIKKSDAINKDKAVKFIDSLIEKYEKMFYDEDMDTFVVKGGVEENQPFYYWSPYLQHFLHETKALTKNDTGFMTEIYITDINETDNAKYYNELTYRNSLFWKVQTQDPNLTIQNNFINISPVNLKETRNLPFFASPYCFKSITPIRASDGGTQEEYFDYLDACLYLFGDKLQRFADVDHYHKVHIMDELHLMRVQDYLKPGDIIYECNRHELEPTKICIALEKTDEDTGIEYTEIEDASVETLVKNANKNLPGMELFNVIAAYLNDKLIIDNTLLKQLNELYYSQSVKNYILVPLVIYALKQVIADAQ